jgi:AhpD family alkylhydroperoxidase
LEIIAPRLAKFRRLRAYVDDCGLERPLREPVKPRVSQINGSDYCIDMHTKDARAGGETKQRLTALSAGRETPFFSASERALRLGYCHKKFVRGQ